MIDSKMKGYKVTFWKYKHVILVNETWVRYYLIYKKTSFFLSIVLQKKFKIVYVCYKSNILNENIYKANSFKKLGINGNNVLSTGIFLTRFKRK